MRLFIAIIKKDILKKKSMKKIIPGVIHSFAPTYYRLLKLSEEKNLSFLRHRLIESGIATLIAAPRGKVRQILMDVLSYAEAQGSFDGVKGLFLSCFNTVHKMRNQNLIDLSIALVHRLAGKKNYEDNSPLFFYDRHLGLLTVLRPIAWKTISNFIGSGHMRIPGNDLGKRFRGDEDESFSLPDLNDLFSDGRSPIGGILDTLGAAADDLDCVINGTGITNLRIAIPGSYSDLASYLCGCAVDNVRGHGSPDATGHLELHDPKQRAFFDNLVKDNYPPPSTEPTPPPDDGRTLDQILGPPDPKLSPEEIDQMTKTPNPETDGGPKGPAYTPRWDDDGGPKGPAAMMPNPEGGGPHGPAYTPRWEDDGGPTGPAAMKSIKAALKNRIYFPNASAFFSPLTGSLNIRRDQLGQMIGFNKINKPSAATFIIN